MSLIQVFTWGISSQRKYIWKYMQYILGIETEISHTAVRRERSGSYHVQQMWVSTRGNYMLYQSRISYLFLKSYVGVLQAYTGFYLTRYMTVRYMTSLHWGCVVTAEVFSPRAPILTLECPYCLKDDIYSRFLLMKMLYMSNIIILHSYNLCVS